MNHKLKVLAAALALISGAAQAASDTTVDFDHWRQGWKGPKGSGGSTWRDTTMGNDAPALHTQFTDFGITFSTDRNQHFLGDYTLMPGVQIGLDVSTQSVFFFDREVTRDLVVELRDYDNAPEGMPYVAVWAKLGTLDAAQAGWQHWSVTISDTHSQALPTGWGGYGAEDPVTFEPRLPDGRTFASVLAGIDEIAFTTYVPGMVFGGTYFDVAIDNISIAKVSPVPEPASLALMAGGLGLLAWRRRGLRRS
ncbi:PEP-CTERM sorting domain-containing protein [Ideonella sp. BN130291]|uniref:PEP-CTERM sorting domain-containing protein n=1 Tax=Ideonella sp. BN130291 TaxID=3112940 RepID=UPI002E261005|nr:PEP-CTERM sorting domain-containing protein [Ideonella sp. BN130291]